MSIDLRGERPTGEQTSASRGAMRRAMFLSQDGVVICSTLRAMDELGILAPSLEADRSLSDLSPDLTRPGFGALRVGVQCLVSTGWLAEPPTLDPQTTVLRWTEAGREVGSRRAPYLALGRFLAGFASVEPDSWTRPWDGARLAQFVELADLACDRWRLPGALADELAGLIRAHLDGALVVPTILSLHETGRLAESGPDLPAGDAGDAAGRLFGALGWTEPDGAWTATGLRARAFALNFGGVATYLPLLAQLPQLYRGELTAGPRPDGSEWHVHRELNLRISALAHGRYFRDTDPIFVELFNREPAETQPRFIADMGCGEGSWLVHLHGLIRDRTRRGRRLESDPLPMIGIDPDPVARERATRNLEAAGVPALVVPGDVTDPDALGATLAEHGLAIEDGLHIRAFIDHERTYLGGDASIPAPGWASGAYLDRDGGPLAGEAVERDLTAHLERWAPHARKHGLILLEAHCVAPRIASRQLGALHGVAFDAHQAYSMQYPVDHAAFIRCCHDAGLEPVGHCEGRYPANRPFVSISLNRLLVAGTEPPFPATGAAAASREDDWRPGPDVDLGDGRALHEMLFTGGDVRHPAMWGSPPTGFVVAGTLDALESRLETAAEGDTIRILDYGTGTGTATVELLKACRERGVEHRLAERGATLELHLVDLPSSWFAQGHALLRDCAWTRFHSLRAPGGGFRPLSDVTGGESMDAVMANMVFHLIPPRALDHAATEIAGVLTPAGRLLWSAPDLGPPGPYAVLLHDPNRALRERWLEYLDGSLAPSSPAVEGAVRAALEQLDDEGRRAAQERADRRILPRPLAADVTAALDRRFSGEIELRAYEMQGEEIVRGLLVPSNQAEYLPEISDRGLREQVIRELMLKEVLPSMQDGPAGTALGLNLHWTLGAYSPRP